MPDAKITGSLEFIDSGLLIFARGRDIAKQSLTGLPVNIRIPTCAKISTRSSKPPIAGISPPPSGARCSAYHPRSAGCIASTTLLLS
jgi:hypothetical protein